MSAPLPVTTLGIDIGSTNTKVALVAVRGSAVTEVAVHARPTPASVAGLLDCVAELLSTAVASAAGVASAPQAIGVASMAETGAFWGDDGPTGDLLRWDAHDTDLTDAAAELVARAGPAALYAATGAPVVAKTPLVRWYALRRAGQIGRLRWSGVADLVAWVLTGELATDHTLAQRTMAYRLPAAGDAVPEGFDAALLELVGMSPHDLPRVLSPGQRVGAIRADAAARSGLPAALPVFLAGHDHAVGAWGAGVRARGEAADSIGTAEALVRLTDRAVAREAARAEGVSLGRDVSGHIDTIVAGNPSAGALIAELTGRLGATELGAPSAGDGLGPLPLGAATAAVRPCWPLLLPYPRGRQSPRPDPEARLRAVDAAGSATELPRDGAALLDAATQGLALQLRWMAEATATLTGGPAERLVVLGGPGARNPRALALRRAVLAGAAAQASVHEPVASAAALFAAVHAGLADPAATLPTRAVDGAGPDPAFDSVYAQFVRAALTEETGAP